VVRKDLPPGLQLSQSCHAALHFMREHRDITEEWMSISDYIVILNIENEKELMQLVDKAKEHDIKVSIFREPDVDDQITAIALEPGIKSKKLCSNLPLALKE
jgi:peptidyl-tRNA hydrolase